MDGAGVGDSVGDNVGVGVGLRVGASVGPALGLERAVFISDMALSEVAKMYV
jgi:hypothetical protein